MNSRILLYFLIVSLALASHVGAIDRYASPTGKGISCTVDLPCPLEYCVETKADDGDVCMLSDGKYSTNSLEVPVGVSIESLSLDKSRVIIEPNTNNDSSPFISFHSSEPGTSGQNQYLAHVTIDGSNDAYRFARGIKITNRDDVSILHSTIRDFNGQADWNGSYAVDASTDEVIRSSAWWKYIDGSFNRVDWPSVMLKNFQFHDNYVVNCGEGEIDRSPFTSAIELWSVKNSSFQRNTIDVSHSYTEAISGTSALLLDVDFIDNILIGHKDGHFPEGTDSLSLYLIELWLVWDCDFINNKTIRGQFSIASGKNCTISGNFIDLRTSEAMSGYGIEATALHKSSVMHNKIIGTSSESKIGYGMHLGLIHAGHEYELVTRAWSNIIHDFRNDGVRISAVERIKEDGTCAKNLKTQATINFHNNLVDLTATRGGGYAGIFTHTNCNGNLTIEASNNIFTNNTIGVRNAGGSPSISGTHNLFGENDADTQGAMQFISSMTSMPTFFNYAIDNFKMVSGDGIDAGIELGAPYQSALKNSTDWGTEPPTVDLIDRSATPWDVGPYEYSTGRSDIEAPDAPTNLQIIESQ